MTLMRALSALDPSNKVSPITLGLLDTLPERIMSLSSTMGTKRKLIRLIMLTTTVLMVSLVLMRVLIELRSDWVFYLFYSFLTIISFVSLCFLVSINWSSWSCRKLMIFILFIVSWLLFWRRFNDTTKIELLLSIHFLLLHHVLLHLLLILCKTLTLSKNLLEWHCEEI